MNTESDRAEWARYNGAHDAIESLLSALKLVRAARPWWLRWVPFVFYSELHRVVFEAGRDTQGPARSALDRARRARDV